MSTTLVPTPYGDARIELTSDQLWFVVFVPWETNAIAAENSELKARAVIERAVEEHS